MADGKVLLEVVVEGKNVKVVQRQVEGVTDAVNDNTSAQDRNTKASRRNADAARAAGDAHNHFDRGLKGASGSSSSTTKNFSKMRDAMGGSSGLVGAYATLAANLFAATAAFGALQKAAQLEQISSGLIYLGKATGVAMGSLSSGLQKATGYGISLGESMKSVAMVTTAGFDSSYIERLGKVARNTSTALGRDLGDSLDRLVRGAIKLEPELLDELGIMIRIDDASSRYAASLGKTSLSLTTFEKQQAFMNAVLEEGEKKFGGIGDSVEINPYDKLSASLQELSKVFLNLVNVALKPFVSFLADNKPILAGFIAVLSKGVITQAFEAFTDFSKVQAVVASQQKNIAVAADAAAKRSVETQKSKLKLFDSSFGKWGKEQNLLLENAKSAKDYEALLQRARKTLALRTSEAVQNRTLDKAAAAERNNFLIQEIASYEKLILLEKRRAMGLAAGAAGRAADKRDTPFSRLRESISPMAPSVPAKAATASSKFANRTAKSLSSLDMDSSFTNYRQQLKYAAASGAQYRKSMKGVEQASLTSFGRIVRGAGQAAVAIRSLGGVAKIAVKGFFAMIPVIGEFVMIAWTVWEVVKAISNAFKSTETKAFEDALESAKTKLGEVSTNSKEVNKALAGQSTTIRSYSQLVEAQSNNLKELNSTFSDLAKKAEDAGSGYSDLVEQANNAIRDNEILTESFKKQSGGLKSLEEWKSKNKKTDEEAAKFALQVIKADDKLWHGKLNVIKSVKEATKATTEYLNSLKQTSPLSNYVDTILNIGKAFDSSVLSFEVGTGQLEEYLLTISNLSLEQSKLLGLSTKQFNDLRQLAREYENVSKSVEAYTQLANTKIDIYSKSDAQKLVKDFNQAIGSEQIKVPGFFASLGTIDTARVDAQLAINTQLELQKQNLDSIKNKTAEILKIIGPIIQARMEEAKDIKLSLAFQQQIIPVLEKLNGLTEERIKARQQELDLISDIKTLENEIKNLKSGGSGIQSAKQAYEIEKQSYAERRSLIEQEADNRVQQLELQKQNQTIELSIQRINLRNTLASSNLNKDEFDLLKANYGLISQRLGLVDDSNAELATREEIIAAETALNNVKSLLVEAQLDALVKEGKLSDEVQKRAEDSLNKLVKARNDQASAEIEAAMQQAEIKLRAGQLLSEKEKIQTIEEIYATKIRSAQSDKEKSLLELEKKIIILGNAVDKEKYQNIIDAAQIEMEIFKTRADIEQKIIDSKKSILDNESKIQEQALMLQNFKNPAIAEYKLTIEQQYALEAESATRRIQLIEQEARIKEDTIKREEALLIAQTNLQRAEMAIRMADVNTRANREVFSDEQATSLLATFDEVISLIPASTAAQIEEVRSGAIVAAGEITGSLAKTAEEIYGWSKNNVVTWQGISQAFGERLKEDLRSSIPLVKQMANAFADSVNAAVDGFVDAIVEGKNIFKAVGDAFRNTLRESFAEMAKNKLKEGIAGIFDAFNLGDMFKTPEQKSAEASKIAAEATAKNTGEVKTATQSAAKALDDSKITWESIKTATETTTPTSINELKNSIDTSVVTGLTTINDTLINVVNTTLTTISNTMSSLLNKPCCEAQQPVTSDLAEAVGAAIRSVPATVSTPMATGGMISGPGGPKDDRIPALLSNGEFVVNAKATQENLKLLQAINSGNLPGFASGGPVRRGVSLYHTKRNSKQLKEDLSSSGMYAIAAEALGQIWGPAESAVEAIGLREVLKDPMYKVSLKEAVDRYIINSAESKELGKLMGGRVALGAKDISVVLGRLATKVVGPLMWLWDSYKFGEWVGNWLNENTDIQGKLATVIDQMTGMAPVTPNSPGMSPLGRAAGGMISGPGGPRDDKIPTMLSNGEFVVNAASTKKYLPLLRAINTGTIPKLKDGTPSSNMTGTPLSWGTKSTKILVNTSSATAQSTAAIAGSTQSTNESINAWGKIQKFATDNLGTVIAAGFTGMATAISSGASPKKAFMGSVLGSLGGAIGGAIGAMAGPAGIAFGSQIGAALGGGIANREFAMGGVMSSSGPMPLQKYANGGIARSPQIAMFGEGSRPEAYVPLPDGRSIPVSMSGGGGNVNNISVNVAVDNKGNAQTQTQSADNTEEYSRRLGVAISNAVKQEMLNQQRPGGLLYKGRR